MEWNFGSKFWKVTFCVLNTWIFDDLRGKLTYSGYYILEYRGAVFLTWRFILSYFFFLLLLTACWVKGKLNLRERCWGKLFLCQFLSSLSLCSLPLLPVCVHWKGVNRMHGWECCEKGDKQKYFLIS